MRTLSLLLSVLFLASSAHAETHHVNPGGSIQAAVNAAQPGDSVIVHTGNYLEQVKTVRPGTATARIYIHGASDSVLISSADDLPDDQFVKTPGFQNIYQIVGVTITERMELRQTYYDSIRVNDPADHISYLMTQHDGPAPLTTIAIDSLEVLDQIPGSYLQVGSVLYVHCFDSVQPSNTGTDLWATWGQPALVIEHDYISVSGFRFHYAAGPSFGVRVEGQHCEIKNMYFVSCPVSIAGNNAVVRNCYSTHNHARGSAHLWYSNCQGSGMRFLGDNISVYGGKSWHNWNGISSEGADNLLVDGLLIHGCPNHAWVPETANGLTLRNMVMYNCQDGIYWSSMRNVLMENCTLFTGVYVQRYPETPDPVVLGPFTMRNCVLIGGLSLGIGIEPTDDVESRVKFENCIFFKVDDQRLFEHAASDQRYDLAAYPSSPGGHHATLTGCVQVNGNFESIIRGGAWEMNRDEWDVALSNKRSIAFNKGVATGALTDHEGHRRPQGVAFDIGADELSLSATPAIVGVSIWWILGLLVAGVPAATIYMFIKRRRERAAG